MADNEGRPGRLDGRVAVITGGASGIGRECALRFSQEGAAVVVADLNPHRAEAVAAEITNRGRQAIWAEVDTSDPEQNDTMAEAAVTEFGRLDVCVAAAGISHAGYVSREAPDQPGKDVYLRDDRWLLGKSLESWQRVIDVNVTGVMLTNQAVAHRMRRTGGGAIVNIASVAGLIALTGGSDYCVSKAGVWMLTRCAALEFGRYGIRVNAVAPGYIRTSMTASMTDSDEWVRERETETPLERLGEPADIANACLYLCSDEASFVTGEILAPDGGLATVMRSLTL